MGHHQSDIKITCSFCFKMLEMLVALCGVHFLFKKLSLVNSGNCFDGCSAARRTLSEWHRKRELQWGGVSVGKEQKHTIPSVVGWIVQFSLKRAALNPGCATCQLCPAVPCGHTELANDWPDRSRGAAGGGLRWDTGMDEARTIK